MEQQQQAPTQEQPQPAEVTAATVEARVEKLKQEYRLMLEQAMQRSLPQLRQLAMKPGQLDLTVDLKAVRREPTKPSP